MSYGQMLEVTDLYSSGKYFFPKFEYLGEEVGFAEKRISCLHEDKQGYLWIGTADGGLFRYDGHTFKSYRFDFSDPYSIPGNQILFIYEDSRKITWIGTDKGLCIYQTRFDRFFRVTLSNSDKRNKLPQIFYCMIESSDNSLLMGANNQIIHLTDIKLFDSISDNTISFNSDSLVLPVRTFFLSKTINSYYPQHIKNLLCDNTGMLWFFYQRNVCYGRLRNDSTLNVSNTDSLLFSYKSICSQDRDTYLYIDCQNNVRIVNSNYIHKTISKNDTVLVVLSEEISGSEIEDFKLNYSNGEYIWMKAGSFFFLYDVSGSNFYPLTFQSSNRNTLHKESISCIYKTSSNVIFIGTHWGGLFKVITNTLPSYVHPNLQHLHLNNRSNLRYAYKDSKGLMWLIADDIYCSNQFTGEIIMILTDNTFSLSNPSYANKILEDKNGRYWIAMEGNGLVYFDILDTGKLATKTKLEIESKIAIDKIHATALYESPDGFIWTSGVYYDTDSLKEITFLFKVNKDGRMVSRFPVKSWTESEIEQSWQIVYHIEKNPLGGLWLATGFGLVSFFENPTNVKIFKYNKNNQSKNNNYRLLTVCPDAAYPTKYLWVGTLGGGLLYFDIEHETFCDSITNKKLEIKHVNSIHIDDSGDFWLGTEDGIFEFSSSAYDNKLIIENWYDRHSGLITNDFTYYYGHNSVNTEHDEFIFTGSNGFHIFNADELVTDSFIPPFYIKDILINYASILNDTTIAYDNKTENLVLNLNHNMNSIGFEILPIDFKAPHKLNYAFQLENYDKSWLFTQNHNSINYTKIPPGTYNLKAKLANSKGIWGLAKSLATIKIHYPWWRTWWAYLFYLLCVSLSVWSLLHFQKRRQRLKLSVEKANLEAEKLKEMDSLKSKFFTNISHEFRTPLTLIMNPVEAMLERANDTADRRSLQIIKRNALQLLHYITEILDLTRLEDKQMKLNVSKVDIVQFTKNLIAPYESWFKQKGITFNLSTSNNKIISLLDPDKLHAIFGNLISNAIKYTPDNGRIDYSIRLCDENILKQCTQNNPCIMVTIRNSGYGIPLKNLPFVFNRYYRTNTETGQQAYGSGIGLNIVKELVTLHQGSIEVESKENEFTIFTIRLPFFDQSLNSADSYDGFSCGYSYMDEVFHHPTDEDIEKREKAIEENGNKIILIIEDNTDMRTIIRAGLNEEYDILEATNGELGEQLAIKSCPDLIISDVMMPKRDGFEVAANLKKNEITNHIPIILLTAKAEMSDKIEGLETGADDYLVKPFNNLELQTRVKNLLSQREKLKDKYSNLSLLKFDKGSDKSIDDIFLQKVVKVIISHFSDENFGVQRIIDELNISRAQLHRKIKALINQTPNELIRNTRLQQASELLKKNTGTISEIAYQVGFKNPSYFNRAFKEYYGHTPSEHATRDS